MKIRITKSESSLVVGREYDLDVIAASTLISKRQAVLVGSEKPKEVDEPKKVVNKQKKGKK